MEGILAVRDLCPGQRLAPEEAPHGISEPNTEEPNAILALSSRAPQAAGQSKTGHAKLDQSVGRHPMKAPSTLSRGNNAGRPTIASQKRSKAATLLNNGRSRDSAPVARKCEACRRQGPEPETNKRHASDERRCHRCTGALPVRRRWVLSDALVNCSPRGKK